MKHPIRRRVLYVLFKLAQAAACWLPLAWLRAIGRALGQTAGICLPAQRRLIDQHLSFAFGDSLSAQERRHIAKGVFLNLGQTFMEWLGMPKLSVKAMQDLITVEGLEHLQAALSRGHGVLACSAHFGNWELISPYLKSLGFEGALLARRLRYPEYESFLISMRAQKGVPTHERGSVKDVARILRENRIIGFMPDQDTEGLEGIFVDFFGHPAYTPAGPAALSLMTGAAIVPCFMIREGAGFRLVITPAVPQPEGVADRKQAIALLTQAWSRVMEDFIRRYPQQWVWMHRRWKSTPESIAARAQARPRTSGPLAGVALALWACIAAGALIGACAGCGSRGNDGKAASKASKAAPAVPDQQLDGFALTGYGNDGSKRWELQGTEASLEGDIVTIQKPNGIGYETDRRAYLTAKQALVHQSSRNVSLREDVTIHTSDGVWFTTPTLEWIPDIERAQTDDPVRIETDHMLIRGRGFDGMAHLKQARVLRDVEVLLNPSDEDRPGLEPKQVTITCSGHLDYEYGKGLVTFHDNVHVIDANGELFSDLMVAYLNSDGRTIRYAEATGNVRIVQQGHHALSDRAVYEPAKGKITLVGKPKLELIPEPGQQKLNLKP
jgi:KDO2-lipid IV(A) lauroyltransferase